MKYQIVIKRLVLITLLAVSLSACPYTGTRFIPNPNSPMQVRRNPQEIEIMLDGTGGRPYDVLGILDCWRGYQGLSLEYVLPEIKAQASKVGGDAAIIRETFSTERHFNVTSEVVRYRD
jgi:hypothetical protein